MNLFETKVTMPKDPSDDVVRAQLAEPHSKCFADVPGNCKFDNHVEHVPNATGK